MNSKIEMIQPNRSCILLSFPKSGATLAQLMTFSYACSAGIEKSQDVADFVPEDNIVASRITKSHSINWVTSQVNSGANNVEVIYIKRDFPSVLRSYAKHMILDGVSSDQVINILYGLMSQIESPPSPNNPYGGWLYHLLWSFQNKTVAVNFGQILNGSFLDIIFGGGEDVAEHETRKILALMHTKKNVIAELEVSELINRVPGLYYNETRRNRFIELGVRFTSFPYLDLSVESAIEDIMNELPLAIVNEVRRLDPDMLGSLFNQRSLKDELGFELKGAKLKKYIDVNNQNENPYIFEFPVWRNQMPMENRLEKNGGSISGVCCICCEYVDFVFDHNLRDSGVCSNCGSINRDRQISYVIKSILKARQDAHIDEGRYGYLRILQIGSNNKFGDIFTGNQVTKTFYNPHVESGVQVNGIRCEDITRLTFPNHSLDFIISSDILEHVNRFESAFSEIARTLKPGGSHIFCVPFDPHNYLNARYCFGAPRDEAIWPNKQFHYDDDGEPVPVYQIFGWELFIDCARHGLKTRAYFVNAPEFGIIGSNAVVFVSTLQI